MEKDRLLAFSDGVVAIIITIMVLELRPPHEATWPALFALAPTFLSYVLSFIYIGIYWNNHHHMLYLVKAVNGGVLWANMGLLFTPSLCRSRPRGSATPRARRSRRRSTAFR